MTCPACHYFLSPKHCCYYGVELSWRWRVKVMVMGCEHRRNDAKADFRYSVK